MPLPLEDEFLAWLAACYPNPPIVGSDQRKQLRDAFYAGVMCAYTSPPHQFSADLRVFASAKLDEAMRSSRHAGPKARVQ